MALDPRTPVLVGVGQTLRKPQPAPDQPEPAEMMAEALRLAERDSGGAGLLGRAQSVRVVDLLSWRYVNPAQLVGQLIGASPAETVQSTVGGNSPQMLLNDAAAAITRGELDVAVIGGPEPVPPGMPPRRTNEHLEWTNQPADTPAPRVM